MSIVEQDLQRPALHWETHEGTVYECRVWLQPEDDGGYSVRMPDLPGVVSEGDDIEDAIANIAEAFKGAAEVYLEDAACIPWRKEANESKPKGVTEKRILVNA